MPPSATQAGKKHDRRIVIADWHHNIVAEFPNDFRRGPVHSAALPDDYPAQRGATAIPG
jgi:hypothetical protein